MAQVVQGRIRIEPFSPDQCNPDSYDYRLGDFLRILQCNSNYQGTPCIDPRLEQKYIEIAIPKEGYLINPCECYLGTTIEKFGSDFYPSQVTGKSSTGRLFVKNHCDADHIDRGFFGHLTLEIVAMKPTLIFPKMRFGQIRWFASVGGGTELYRGKYGEDSAAAPSRAHLDFSRKTE